MTPTLTLPPSSCFFFLSSLGGLHEQERKPVRGLHVALDLKKGFEEAYTKKEDREGRGLWL